MNGSWNFARRPFRNERPVLALIAVAFVAGLVLLVANAHLLVTFSRRVEGTRGEIAALEERRARAAKSVDGAKTALANYKLSSLAQESSGLQTIVRERRFSWLGLLERLERTLPSDVRLSRLTPHFDAGDTVRVEFAAVGRAPNSVVRTLAALSRDPAFEAVEVRSESTPEKGVPEGYSFQLTVRYLPEEKR